MNLSPKQKKEIWKATLGHVKEFECRDNYGWYDTMDDDASDDTDVGESCNKYEHKCRRYIYALAKKAKRP